MSEETTVVLTDEQKGERIAALREAGERQNARSDDGNRLGPERECQHAGRWQRYCQGRRPKRAVGSRLGVRVA